MRFDLVIRLIIIIIVIIIIKRLSPRTKQRVQTEIEDPS